MAGRPLARIIRVLAIGRATAYRERGPRARRYHRRDDAVVYAQLKAVLRDRGSYGYRRATVLVNRAYGAGYNRKRIQRVMRLTGLALAVRRRRRNGRLFEMEYMDEGAQTMARMTGRARLSPYYFVTGEKAELAGILATICPADKKVIHGMKNAIMAPCAVVKDDVQR